jgi:hypothetical protein
MNAYWKPFAEFVRLTNKLCEVPDKVSEFVEISGIVGSCWDDGIVYNLESRGRKP